MKVVITFALFVFCYCCPPCFAMAKIEPSEQEDSDAYLRYMHKRLQQNLDDGLFTDKANRGNRINFGKDSAQINSYVMKQKTDKIQNKDIHEANRQGLQLIDVMEEYSPRPVTKTKWEKFKDKISNTFFKKRLDPDSPEFTPQGGLPSKNQSGELPTMRERILSLPHLPLATNKIPRKFGGYRAIMVSPLLIGTSSFVAKQPDIPTAPETTETMETLSGSVTYLPSIEAGIRLGIRLPAPLFTNKHLDAYRVEIELSYTWMNSSVYGFNVPDLALQNLIDQGQAAISPGGKGYGSGHLFSLGFNLLFDLKKHIGPLRPFGGFGVSAAIKTFDKYLSAGFVAPIFHFMVGATIDLPKGIILSVGYKFSFLFPTDYGQLSPYIPYVPDRISDHKGYTTFGISTLHKIEFSFLFF